MKLLDLKNITKKDIPLYYRNEFSGTAHFSGFNGSGKEEVKHSIEFSIERSALGKIEVSVRIVNDVDYPLVPIIKLLKTHILDLEKKGLLP